MEVTMGQETEGDNKMQSHHAHSKFLRQYMNQHIMDRRNALPFYTTVLFYVIQTSMKCLGYIIQRYCSKSVVEFGCSV